MFSGCELIWTIVYVGYQFDYVFDWTVLKYPQMGGSSRGRVSTFISMLVWNFSSIVGCLSLSLQQQHGPGKAAMNAGPHVQKPEKISGPFSFKDNEIPYLQILNESDVRWSGILNLLHTVLESRK